VAAGEITREAALLEMGHPPCSPNESAVMLEYVLKKLEITVTSTGASRRLRLDGSKIIRPMKNYRGHLWDTLFVMYTAEV